MCVFGYSTRSVHSGNKGNKGNKGYKGNVHQGNNGLTLKGEQRPSTKGTRQAWSACAGHVHQALPGRSLMEGVAVQHCQNEKGRRWLGALQGRLVRASGSRGAKNRDRRACLCGLQLVNKVPLDDNLRPVDDTGAARTQLEGG